MLFGTLVRLEQQYENFYQKEWSKGGLEAKATHLVPRLSADKANDCGARAVCDRMSRLAAPVAELWSRALGGYMARFLAFIRRGAAMSKQHSRRCAGMSVLTVMTSREGR